MNNTIKQTYIPSFNGAFLMNYRNAKSGSRKAFEESFNNFRGYMFEDFCGKKNSVLYITKNGKDYNAANFIANNREQLRLSFRYIPEIDTRLQLYKPKEVIDYIENNKPLVISKAKELLDFVKENRSYTIPKSPTIKQEDICTKFLRTIKLDMLGNKNRDERGVTTLRSQDKNGLVMISPVGKYGISFAYVKPNNLYENESRYAINQNGEILANYKTPDGMRKFKENFAKAVQFYIDNKK